MRHSALFRRALFAVLLATTLFAPLCALAQSEEDLAALEGEYTREATHTTLAAVRIVHLPGFLLDIWFDKHANHWDGQANMAYGLEYAYRKIGSFDLQFGVFFTDLSMKDGYWLEKDKKDDWAAADFTKQGLSTVSAEANFFGYYDFIPEFGVFYGGGLWFGGVLGKIEKASVNEICATNAHAGTGRLSECPLQDSIFVEEDGVPPVAGFVSVSAGLRAEIEQRFIVKLEGGFKGYFFGGISMGAQFW